jgi:hypothetical protein
MSRHRAVGLALVVLHISLVRGVAQERETVTQGIEWFAAHTVIQFNDKFTFLADGHVRLAQAFKPMQFQARAAGEFALSKQWSFIPLGYAYTWNPLYGKQPNRFVNNEHRLFEQITFKHSARAAKLSHRLRLEQRFMEVHTMVNNELANHGYDLYTNRFRYKFQLQAPISTREDGEPLLDVVVWDELFVSFGENVTFHKPDQNRAFAGVSYHFAKNLSLIGGPYYQLLIKAGGTKQENNIGVWFTLLHQMTVGE